MPDPAGERLARLSRAATIRAAALTGRIGPDQLGTAGLAAVLYRSGGCAPARGIDERWPQLLLRRAERPVRAACSNPHAERDDGVDELELLHDADSSQLVHKVYVSPAMTALAEP